jgi:acyl-ACP thioesterase
MQENSMKSDLVSIDENNIAHSFFTTYSYETDCFAEARLAFYFQIVQEAAGMHAAMRGCSINNLHKEGKTWVITRSSMEIMRYTCWPEVIEVQTWAQEPIRLHLPRVVKGFDKAGNALFTAKTHWAILDLDSGRPLRPMDMSLRIGLPPADHTLDMTLPKKQDDENQVLLCSFKPTIAYLDTDRNLHVNNISYLNWALESLPSAFRNRCKVASVDVSYLRQTYLEDDLCVYTYGLEQDALFGDEPTLRHTILRKEKDGTTTLVWSGTTGWKRREDLR